MDLVQHDSHTTHLLPFLTDYTPVSARQQPPKFTTEMTDQKAKENSSEVEFKCAVSGVPRPGQETGMLRLIWRQSRNIR